jgi:Fe2+ or Zn2+ uptake regulation protein
MAPATEHAAGAAEADARLTAALRGRGQRVTSQRLVIHRALVEEGRHVTAEQVLTAVAERLPGVALPTVYATLDLLEELGLVRRVAAGSGAALFDPRTEPHHHLVCRACGATEDLDVPLDLGAAAREATARGFTPRHVELTVTGLCAACCGSGARSAGAR